MLIIDGKERQIEVNNNNFYEIKREQRKLIRHLDLTQDEKERIYMCIQIIKS